MGSLILVFLWAIIALESLCPAIPACIITAILGYLFNLFWYNRLSVFQNRRLLFYFILSVFILLIQVFALMVSLSPNDPSWGLRF